MDNQLTAVAESQGQWSATANAMKESFERTRFLVFVLSTLAALAAAISSQQAEGTTRTTFAMFSTVCMGVVSFLSARLLDSRHSQGWVRARAASEALKREGYRYAAQAAPYDSDASRGALLRGEAQKIEADVDDLIGARRPSGKSSMPTELISAADYVAKRVQNQIAYYEDGANKCQASAQKFRGIEFILALATAVLTALVGILSKKLIGEFDLVALTAVLTTLSGAILAYIEASRYDFTVSTYRATARRLRDQKDNPPANPQPGTPDWSTFVNSCESILQEQNSSWVAKFGKPS